MVVRNTIKRWYMSCVLEDDSKWARQEGWAEGGPGRKNSTCQGTEAQESTGPLESYKGVAVCGRCMRCEKGISVGLAHKGLVLPCWMVYRGQIGANEGHDWNVVLELTSQVWAEDTDRRVIISRFLLSALFFKFYFMCQMIYRYFLPSLGNYQVYGFCQYKISLLCGASCLGRRTFKQFLPW